MLPTVVVGLFLKQHKSNKDETMVPIKLNILYYGVRQKMSDQCDHNEQVISATTTETREAIAYARDIVSHAIESFVAAKGCL